MIMNLNLLNMYCNSCLHFHFVFFKRKLNICVSTFMHLCKKINLEHYMIYHNYFNHLSVCDCQFRHCKPFGRICLSKMSLIRIPHQIHNFFEDNIIQPEFNVLYLVRYLSNIKNNYATMSLNIITCCIIFHGLTRLFVSSIITNIRSNIW